MKKMKRLLAYVLCFAMLASIFPMSVAAEERAIDEPLEQDVVIEGVTREERTVYVLADSLTNRGKYLISNKSLTSGNDENGVILVKNGNNIGYQTIEVQKGTIHATNENTYSDGYIVLDPENANAVWTVASTGNSWNRTWSFSNSGSYLRASNQGVLSLGDSGTQANWSYSNQHLTRNSRYLYFDDANSAWATRTNASNIYFYQEVAEESHKGQDVIYKVQAESLEHVLDVNAAGYSDVAQLDYAFLKDGQEMTTLPEGGSFTFEVINDENAIIDQISETGAVTFNRVEGIADVKISYTWTMDGTEYTAYKYVEVSTTEPSYAIDITHEGESVTQTVVIKGVSEATRYQLGYNATYTGKDGKVPVTPAAGTITWTTNRPDLATVDQNGLVSFKAANGVVQITVIYTYATGESVTDIVAFSISVEEYITPEDGTGAFPEYPNEGSVRFDKTATSVGTFSETGIAQLELSMTGVPFTEGNTMDVVLMLDHSNSMTEARMAATRAATEVFIKNIVTNTDGSFNKNRIYVGSFAGGNPDYAGQSRHEFRINQMTANEQDGYQIIDNQTELDALIANVNRVFVKPSNPPYGTEYAQSLQKCYELLKASKEDENKQFCVFMSDGIPNVYKYGAGTNDKVTSSSAMANMFTGTNYDRRDTDYKYEYYSSLMKADGVTVFTVGLGLHGTNSSLNGASAAQCENVSNILLNDISGPAGELAANRDTGTTISKLNNYFYSVADADAAEEMGNVFGNIAQKIQEAAKDVKVTDKIADKYTMVFDFPNAEVEGKMNGIDQDFYIEAKEYDLIPEMAAGEIVDYKRTGTPNTLLKVYMGTNEDGSYYAASDANGTRHAAPAFTEMPLGKEYYWTTDATKGNAEIAVADANNTMYYFAANGNGTHNMVSGAYAYGTPVTTDIMKEVTDPTTGEISLVKDGKNTTCQNLIIATPYFVYDAETRMLVWTAEKLSTKELTLTYFLYLENSGGYVGNHGETLEGTYETNDFANLNYTNFQGVECEQKFPVPQMTWNGAQVSYVFYLVNKDGIPVNRAGRKVPFSEAVYVTDTYTYSVTWNDENMSGALEAKYLATNLVPDVYELYDKQSGYDIYVYETESGADKNNHFVIKGDSTKAESTYVFNTKADATKYTAAGEYDADKVHSGFDFANTTVAFAVLWKPELVEDVVVIDYGLPVDIDVLANDNVAGAIVGLQNAYSGTFENVEINKGVLPPRMPILPSVLAYGDVWSGMKFGDAEVLSNTTVRYTPKSMEMDGYDLFHYVVTMNYYETDGTLLSPSMYSSVKVVPANNVYFEDTTTFVQYSGAWTQEGSANTSATQDVDRPGASKISEALDKDNVYGYDSAYVANDTFSLGGAHKVTVSAEDNAAWPTASFTFTGTAFDVISMTSNQTGTITVQVVNDDGKTVGNWFVDTYYGYTYTQDAANPYLKRTFVYGTDDCWHVASTEPVAQKGEDAKAPANPKAGDSFVTYEDNKVWRVTNESDNALYQIPVIKSPELTYDTYTVTITARYAQPFNHLGDDSYDFYLDGIRTYNPVSTDTVLDNGAVLEEEKEDVTVGDIYKEDGEAYPVYAEIRENLLKQNSFDAGLATVNGAMFIDGFGEIPAPVGEISKDNITVSVSGTYEMTGKGEKKDGNDYTETPEELKGVLFDGDNTTFWNSNWETGKIAQGNPYLQLELDAAYSVHKVEVAPRYSGGWNCTGNPRNLIVEVSTNGTDWTTVTAEPQAIPTNLESTAMAAVEFDEVNAKYIRLSATQSYHLQTTNENTSITFGEVTVHGQKVVFGDEIAEYEAYGPNNEVYLKKGQAVAFRIEDANAANYVAAHLGVKSPNGADVKVTVSGAKDVDITTSSATEQYYNIKDCVAFDEAGTSNLIIITNTSTGDAMVSLTNVKVTHSAAGTAQTIEFRMSSSDAAYASSFVYDQYINSIPVELPPIVEIWKSVTEIFGDILNNWYVDYVQFVYDKGIMMGSNGNFSPNKTLTRAMTVTTLYRMAGSPEVTDRTACAELKDVQAGQWYTDAVCWAYEQGITTGNTHTMTFGVDDAVTREQLATFLYRYAKNCSLDITQQGELLEFKNADKVNDYAKEAVSWMVGTGLLSGVPNVENGTTVYDLAPTQSGTRAQMAAILTRFCEAYGL